MKTCFVIPSGCSPLSSLSPERVPDKAEEKSEKWQSYLHLHRYVHKYQYLIYMQTPKIPTYILTPYLPTPHITTPLQVCPHIHTIHLSLPHIPTHHIATPHIPKPFIQYSTCAVRKPELQGQTVELKQPISQRDYNNLLAHRDDNHLPIFKTRRSFLYENQQYQLDIYRAPCHSRCQNLILLETFTTSNDEELIDSLPPFLQVKKNVTGDPAFSMYNLSIRSDWEDSAEQFCHRLSSDDEEEEEHVYDVRKAHQRLVQVSEENTVLEVRRSKREVSESDNVFGL